jgi:predicted RNA binding protein YcfA (HicA-like mRNA interferase family)
MRSLEITVENITYAELATALQKLGFKKVNDPAHFKYAHKESGAEVVLGKAKEDAQVYAPYIAGIASVLEGYGLINEAPLLWKMIEQIRQQEKAAA